MLRKTLTILSLVGLVVSVGLWALSYFKCKPPPNIYWAHGTTLNCLLVCRGTMTFANTDQPFMASEEVLWNLWVGSTIAFNRLRARASTSSFGQRNAKCIVHVPLYVPTMIFTAALCVLIVPRYRGKRRRKLGLCVKCAYDLRGSTDHCPECNTPIER